MACYPKPPRSSEIADARASWNGFLKLSLVSCPVYLSPATTETKRIRLNQLNSETGNRLKQLNSETGNRLKQQLIDTDTGEVAI